MEQEQVIIDEADVQAGLTLAQTAPGPDPEHPKRVRAATLRVLADYLIVAPLAVSGRNAGGVLFMPDSAGVRERSQRGVVLQVGPGDWNEAGTAIVPLVVQAGDLVFFGKYAGTEEEFDRRTVLVMRETECRISVPAGDFQVVEHENPKHNHLIEDWCDLCHGDPDAEAKARLAADREQLVKAASVVCVCGCVAGNHAHQTGPCKNHEDCLEFTPAAGVTVPVEGSTTYHPLQAGVTGPIEFPQTDPDVDEATQLMVALRVAGYSTAMTGAGPAKRPCPGLATDPCLYMQKLVRTLGGSYWVGARCQHVHPASVSLEP